MSIRRLIPIVLLFALVPLAAYAAVGTMHAQASAPIVSPPNTVNTSVSISVTGTASPIDNSTHSGSHGASHSDASAAVATPVANSQPQSSTVSASATIKGTVILSTNGTMRFNVTGTSLTIGSTTYTVVNGSGIVNQHSMIVVLHATVMNGSTTGHLILIGRVTGTSHPEGGTGGMNVSFNSPQSKLASQFFLSLTGTLTLS